MELAINSAPSQDRDACKGDQPIRTTSGGVGVEPKGSNIRTDPLRWRAPRVASKMSALVEVVTTAPGAAMTFGTITLEVLPDRVGPRINALR